MTTSTLRHTVDATGHTLGRLATRVAHLLRGKDQPTFTPHVDSGAMVHVTNLRKVRFTGSKPVTKVYARYSGYPGGLRSSRLAERWTKHPELVLRDAVYGMLPPNRTRSRMIRRMTVTW